MSLHIPLDKAHAGMVLAAALYDQHGATLLPQGCTLTDALLMSLRQRGIDAVTIENPAAADDAPGSNDAATAALKPSQQAIDARIAFLFRHTDQTALPLREALAAWHLREDE